MNKKFRLSEKEKILRIWFRLTSLVFVILFLSLQISANGNASTYEPNEKVPMWSEFLEGTADALTYFLGNFIQNFLLISASTKEILELSKITYGNFESLLLQNPEISDQRILILISYTIKILAPLYVTAITLIGIYLIFISASPMGRARAKSYLLRLILSMVLISISPEIMKILLSTSNALTQNILSFAPRNFLEIHESTILNFARMTQNVGVGNINFGAILILLSYLITLGAFLFLIVRYILVIILAVLMPIAIFLFGFSLTRDIGKILIAMIFFCVFLPVSFAIVVVSVAIGENLLHSVLYEFSAFGIAGTLLLIFSPVGMFYITNYLRKILAKKISKNFNKFEQTLIPELKERLSEKEIEEQLKELSDRKRRIALERLKQRRELYRELEEEAKKKEMSMQEYIAEWYGMKVIEKKEPYVVEYPKTITITPATEAKRPSLRELSKAEKEIIVKLGLKVKPAQVAVSVERDNSTKFTLNVENLTPLVLHSINFIEQDLAEEDILVDYSEKKFDLKPGEVKAIKVKITVMEDAKIKTYEGTIFVTCREGFKNFVDIKVDVKPKETEPLLKDLADEYGEVSYETLKEENLELYEQLKKEAAEQGKTLEEYATEKYGIKIVGIPKEEKGIEREKVTTEMRAIKAEVERVKETEEKIKPPERFRSYQSKYIEKISEEEKVKIEKEEKFILAPLAQKAKPKIVKIENF
ncbi:MAG: hypothetical protein QXY62_02025 [Candidatus Altiarchaeota archaeon]